MGLSREKSTQLKVNIWLSYLAKGLALIVAFFSTPAYLAFFNNGGVLGFWFTVLSVLNWILFFDFGVGNGLRSHLTRCLSEHDKAGARRYVSTAYIALGVPVLLVALVGCLLFSVIDLNAIFNIESTVISSHQLRLVVIILFLGILLQLWLRIIVSALYALQKTAIPGFINLFSSVLVLFVLLLPVALTEIEKLMLIAIVQVISINAPLILASILCFRTDLAHARPSVRYFDKGCAREILGLGGLFFYVQIALMVISATNEILITNICSPNDVVYYTVYYRVFNLLVTLFGLMVQPLWSALAREFYGRNFSWMRQMHKKFVLGSVAVTALAFLISMPLQPVFDLWLGSSSFTVSAVESGSFVVFVFAFTLMNSSTCIANAINKLMPQVVALSVGMLLKVPLSIFFVALLGGAWCGVVFANAVALLPCSIIQMICIEREFKSGVLANP